MRPRRPGQSVPSTSFYSFRAKPGNNTKGMPRTSPTLATKGTEERSVQRGTHPNQIPPKQENSSHFQRNTASMAGSHSSSKGPSVGAHKCPLDIKKIKKKSTALKKNQNFFIAYLFFSSHTRQQISQQLLLPVPLLSSPLPSPSYLPVFPFHLLITSLKLQASLPTQNRGSK